MAATRAQLFCVPKRGLDLARMEDVAWMGGGSASDFPRRFAISDGATEAIFSRLWATTLTRALGRGELDDFSPRALEPARRIFRSAVAERLSRMRAGGGVPWYVDEKLVQGSFATLLGLRLEAKGRFEAVAVGDSCLVQVDAEGQVRARFPLASPDEFGTRPALVGSDPARDAMLVGEVRRFSGTFARGDTFFLMTDAFAAWFYAGADARWRPWLAFDELDPARAADREKFTELVEVSRDDGEMRNDDVLVLRVRAGESAR